MKSSVQKLAKSIVELTIEESKENIAKYRKKVIADIRKNADIKGFRKGANIPEEVIVKNYGEEKISALMIDAALNTLYGEALKSNKILPVAQGEIKEIKSQDPLVVVMNIEVFPEVEIDSKYKKITLPKTLVSVTDEEVEQTLAEIQKKFTKFVPAPAGYVSKMGDKISITTQGYDLKGNKLENTNMESYPLVLGSKLLVPGFEEGLVGSVTGAKLELPISFPKDYHNADFAGKKTKFEVQIGEIEEAIVPEFTPQFIKDLRGKDLDLAGFKALIKEELLETKENNARMEDESKLIDELLTVSKVDFGENLLKNQIQKVYAEIKENIASSGAKVADYIASLGLTEEAYIQKNVTPVATKRLQAELILHKLSELEKIEIAHEDMEKEIEKILARFGSAEVVERLKELYKEGTKYYEELKQRLIYRNLIDGFFK